MFLGVYSFSDVTNTGGAVQVSIYAPYLVWNMTGMDMEIKSKSFLRQADIVSYKIKPKQSCIFSYDTDDRKNRALIKVGPSTWSPPQSFEAVGQASECVIEGEMDEAHLGINVETGLGQYKLTKVVTIRPRYIVESFLDEPIYYRQPGAKEYSVLDSGGRKDIIFLRSDTPRLCLRFGGNRNKWSNPFNIQDLGKVYVKLDKVEGASDLVKVNVIINEATIRLQITQVKDQKLWPYQIKNLTDKTITFYQKVTPKQQLISGRGSLGERLWTRVYRIQLLPPYSSQSNGLCMGLSRRIQPRARPGH
jgi:vacuolar protein sorting-associated protein 13A/C